MPFKILKEGIKTRARVGIFETASGKIKTPAFFPVATQAAVKGMSSRELNEVGISGLLVNAYHLYLRPGVRVIEKIGGIHKFMGFYGPIISDSGGYQIFSLARLRQINDEGVTFQSHIDGSTKFFSPAEVIKIQLRLKTDIVVPLDECVKLPVNKDYAAAAVKRTVKWAEISKRSFERNKTSSTLFFGILQGATYLDLRQECVEEIVNLGVDGVAIGGLSVGESSSERHDVLSCIGDKLDPKYLKYFMGYGKPVDIIEAVERGIDLFDCVIPTRLARTGTAFSWSGKIVVRNASFIHDSEPIDSGCSCYVCRNFSRAYIRHLINVKEMLAVQLLTYHNIWWYNSFMQNIQFAIEHGKFVQFKKEFLSVFKDRA
ncbi:MAG: tRNA guanosine(34) transglycosylase Tgt [Candidatus Omnitrophota bacterium]